MLAYGLVTLGLGIALLVWPDATIAVFAVLLAIQLIIGGIFRIVTARRDEQAWTAGCAPWSGCRAASPWSSDC